MGKLLLINTSPKVINSDSRDLSQYCLKIWLEKFPLDDVIERDIGAQSIPHLQGDDAIFAIENPEMEVNSEGGKETRELSDKLIAEIKAADQIVFAVPMHNLIFPSSLLAYFHHLAVAGKTWGGVKYGTNKQVLVITTGGGLYQDTERDYQAAYIRDFLKTIDLLNITFIRAHGLCKSVEHRNSAMSQAKEAISAYITAQAMKKLNMKEQLGCQAQLLTQQSAVFNQYQIREEVKYLSSSKTLTPAPHKVA